MIDMLKKIWQGVIFPILIYMIGAIIGAVLQAIAPSYIDATMLLGICSIFTIVVLYLYAKNNMKLQVDVCFNDEKKIDIIRAIYIIPIAFSFSLICNVILNMTNLTSMFPKGGEVSETLLGSNHILTILIGAILVPMTEEILFRGYIYKSIKGYGSKMIASIISALLFSLAHGNITQGIYAFAVTFLFIYIYDEMDNIWASMFAHIIANASVLLLSMAGINYELMIFRQKILFLIVCVALFMMGIYRFITYKKMEV